MADITTAPRAEADLHKAIREVARGDSSYDAARRRVVKRATALGLQDRIPDAWRTDGTLNDPARAWANDEQRETYNDLYQGLSAAVDEQTDGDFYWTWVQDFTDTDVIYIAGGDMYSAPYTLEEDGPITIGDPVKVRPVTTYVEAATRSHRAAGSDPCPECDGTGEIDGEPCPECDGTGELAAARKAGPLVEWRKKKAGDLRGLERREFSTAGLELRDKDAETWNLTGYACVTETPYEVGFYTEVIKRGAFKRTLSENPDVQLLVNHEGLPLARTRSGTLRLEERERGLWVDADLDKRDPDAQRLQLKMERRDIDQMSFAFQATDQEWNEDYTERQIRVVGIHRGDVSVVNQGANPATMATIRSAEALQTLGNLGPDAFVAAMREWRDHTLLPLEARAGKTLSSGTMDVLTQVLNLVAAADEAVDEAQPLLAELMGVPNPDADDDPVEPDGDDGAAARAWTPPDHTTEARQRLAVLQNGRR